MITNNNDIYWFINDPSGKIRKELVYQDIITLSGAGQIYTDISGEPCNPVPLWAGGDLLPEILQDISSQRPIISGNPDVVFPMYCPGELNAYADDYIYEDL